jgi:hypothetical protein
MSTVVSQTLCCENSKSINDSKVIKSVWGETTVKTSMPHEHLEKATVDEFIDELKALSPTTLNNPERSFEPIFKIDKCSYELESISPTPLDTKSNFGFYRKLEGKEWSRLSKVSTHLKQHIITTPFFASRLDLHCVDCVLCHGCYNNLPKYIRHYLKHWRNGRGIYEGSKPGRTCKYCLPCDECSEANCEIMGDRHGLFYK